ncbi:MAG: hypothetical protein NZV14_08255 [Bryobacteraceae bacterium]|nr:hypothetical protein [Bryobacteraceae bacterium]MDW8378140.1 hypothetical protein [Bryobacterales bacterium]
MPKALEALIPIRKEIDVVNGISDGGWKAAIFQTDWDEKGVVEGLPLDAIERIAQLGLELSAFAYGAPRKQGNEVIGHRNCRLNAPGPILPGQQLFFIEPRVAAALFQFLEDSSRVRKVFLHISKKHFGFGERCEN